MVFLVHWFLCPTRGSKNFFLIFASYLFYGWWDWRFLILIILISILGFTTGILIERSTSSIKRNIYFYFSVIIIFSTLFIFKYFNFFIGSFIKVLEAVGFTPDMPTLNLILPVGISFYTFQAVSYIIDIWRKQQQATYSISTFFVFISFFPQLVAGPIERASNILPQFEFSNKKFTYEEGVGGMKLILWGLFKKMVVADNAAIIVNKIFMDWPHMGTPNLWIGAILFSFQIYGDFSGYSDIAIGTARLFGINLLKNFSMPYFSRDLTEFWKKWHISLTGWFRDYVYIPLGGNRKGKAKSLRNTMIVFLISGLWHGANFTYVLWGTYHAILFIPSRLINRKDSKNIVPVIGETFVMGITFLLVMIGWVIFRAETVGDAFGYIAHMFTHFSDSSIILGKTACFWCIVLLFFEWKSRRYETPFSFPTGTIMSLKWVKWLFCLIMFFIVMIFAGSAQEFIYFKF